jgi:hypothetical protein
MATNPSPSLGRLKALQVSFRRKRFRRVEALISKVVAEKGSCTVLDVGGRGDYWQMLCPTLRTKTDIEVMNYSSELVSYAASPKDYLRVTNVIGNACSMPNYRDRQFDLVHSNSVIEHVTSYQNMILFSQEFTRVGRFYYIQTPNYFFPIDPHYAFPFIHWLPDNLKIRVLASFKVGTAITGGFADAMAEVDNCRMLGRWIFKRLFPEAHHFREPFLGLFTKSLIAVGSRYEPCPALD